MDLREILTPDAVEEGGGAPHSDYFEIACAITRGAAAAARLAVPRRPIVEPVRTSLLVTAGTEIKLIRDCANLIIANGGEPVVGLHRDEAGMVVGVWLGSRITAVSA